MEVRFLPNDIEFWIQARITPPRSNGVHVSELVLKMLQTVSKHFRQNYGRGDQPDRHPRYEMGYAWEDALSKALSARGRFAPNQTLLPGEELECQGIYGTPDRVLFDHDEHRFVDDELKATWLSCRDVETSATQILDAVKFQYWLAQKKTYAAMLHKAYGVDMGAPLPPALAMAAGRAPRLFKLSPDPRVAPPPGIIMPTQPPIAIVRALFVNGNYAGDICKPLAWEFRYTAEELTAWWDSVVRFRDEHFSPVSQEQPQP